MRYPLDPELTAALAIPPTVDLGDPAAARAEEARRLAASPEPDTTGVTVHDVTVPRPDGRSHLTLRVYTPSGPRRPLPALYDIHGGGFVLGSIEATHARSIRLCRELGTVVVAVAYRLAPEHPYPAPLQDCYAGLAWLAAHAADLGIDATRIAVHGQSAGGGLAAAVALLARDRGGPAICFQYLGVPAVDDRLSSDSMRQFVDTPAWDRPSARLSWSCYLGTGIPGTDDVSPYAAPARATDLSDLPPAYITAMQFDPLRDEGIAYALALQAAGVSVELHLFPGTFHGSVGVPAAEVSRRELAEETAVLRRALRPCRGT
ncbi:alpha/beta hydrolase [Streptomyces antimycoticus]|uniref:Esterase n=1 Tax=Streptomyces antimycoticus TaxID=68175 RepID=A0A499UWH2_9ACTN|nr:alpha/beta hydrolase [Streptomyces antimycoticus]BBJ46403.1 esterase [Streptomyces antimycoticus]